MRDKTKTLVILSPGFPENEADTTCVPPQQVFVRNLKKTYPQLNIIVLAFIYPFAAAQYQWNDITVIAFAGNKNQKIFRLANWVRVWFYLRKLKKQYELIGLLSFWMGECALVANTFAKWNRLKHFCWVLGQDAKPGNRYFRWIKPKSETLIALSDFIAREVNRNYAITPANVIPAGIDTTLFGPPSSKRDIDILGAGSLISLKQYYILVNMVNYLRYNLPNIKVAICGKGPEAEPLSHMIKILHLEDNIELMGELPHASVLALMQRTKVFVHPSAYEGLGMVCLEALYAGAQVVSFVRPMDTAIKNWHFANAQDEMLRTIRSILDDPNPDHSPVSPYIADDTAKAIMRLFNYSEAAIS